MDYRLGRPLAPLQWARLEDVSIDANVLVFAVALCLVTTILLGIIPAWRASRSLPLQTIRAGARGSMDGPRGNRMRGGLIAIEVALGTVLLISSGLLLASLHRILNAPRGFAIDNVAGVDLRIPMRPTAPPTSSAPSIAGYSKASRLLPECFNSDIARLSRWVKRGTVS